MNHIGFSSKGDPMHEIWVKGIINPNKCRGLKAGEGTRTPMPLSTRS